MPSLYLPHINPIKLVQQNYLLPNPYHQRPFDETLFAEQIYSFQEERDYYQTFQAGDTIYFQAVSDFGAVQARLINCSGDILVTGVTTAITNTFYTTPNIAYGCTINLTGVTTGYYYVQAVVGVGSLEIRLISEPIYIDTDIENTILFEYTHNKNAYGAIFQNKETFHFRCPAILTDFQPGVNEIVFEDQPANVVRLSSTPFRSYKLIIGDAYGVPDWVADKINRIFGMDKIWLDGQQFVRADGAKLERNGNRLYPMAGWTLEVREAKAKNGITFSSSVPPDNEVIMIRVEDYKLFGTFGDPSTDATILKVEKN